MSEMNVTSSTSVSSTYTGYQGAAKTEDKAKTTDLISQYNNILFEGE